jgi:hypothetical protein
VQGPVAVDQRRQARVAKESGSSGALRVALKGMS